MLVIHAKYAEHQPTLESEHLSCRVAALEFSPVFQGRGSSAPDTLLPVIISIVADATQTLLARVYPALKDRAKFIRPLRGQEILRNSRRRLTSTPPNHSPLLSRRYLPANLVYTSDAEFAPGAATPGDRDRESPFALEGLLSSGDRWLRRTRIPTRPPPRQILLVLRASPTSETSCWLFVLLPDCSRRPAARPSESQSLRSTLRHRATDAMTRQCAPRH